MHVFNRRIVLALPRFHSALPSVVKSNFHSWPSVFQVDSAAQVAFILANLTEEADNLQSEDITIASALLDSIANSSDIQGDSLVRQSCTS